LISLVIVLFLQINLLVEKISIPDEKFTIITGKKDLFVPNVYTDRVLFEKKITVLERHELDCGHFEMILPCSTFGKDVVNILLHGQSESPYKFAKTKK
jgi:hypothetical protein